MNAPVEPDYFAFISYSHQDQVWADWLHKALETYRVPRRLVGETTAAGTIPARLVPIFRDREDLASANDLARKVNAALARSRNLIVICSPHAAASRWVNEEVLAFKRQGGAERVFCLIVGGEPNASSMPGREVEECFAPALRHVVDASGALTGERAEPIAADARAGKDGKANAKLKLVAGMLDVGFDVLKQRELHRRNRRLALLATAALVVMAITTTLAITAVIARHDAERRQKQAEDLVSFMLGDLNDKLREVQRLDILQAVDDKAMAYFASLPTVDVTDAALTMRIDALQKIGGVRQDQGNVQAALEAFEAASALARQMLQRAPDDVDRQAEYANSLTWIGKVYWYQGNLEKAKSNFEIASEKLRAAAAAKPVDSDLAYRLSSALTNTGRVLELGGQFDAAEPYYRSVLQIFEAVSAREPKKALWRAELGDAHNNLGKLAFEQGHLDRAIAEYAADLDIKRKLTDADAQNHDLKQSYAVSSAILGRTLALCAGLDESRRYLGDAVDGLKSLLDFDASNTEWRYLLARYSEQLGGVLRQQVAFDAAAVVDNESLRILEELTRTDPTNTEWQQEFARSRLESARLSLSRDAHARALDLALAARETVDALREKTPEDRNLLLLAAQVEIVLGEVSARQGTAEHAREAWLRARDLLAEPVRTGNDINFNAAWATALLLLGDRQNAQGAIAKLAQVGYSTPDFVTLANSKQIDYLIEDSLSRRLTEAVRGSVGAIGGHEVPGK
jgi:tetratricopeptide (TPR) repeat protein